MCYWITHTSLWLSYIYKQYTIMYFILVFICDIEGFFFQRIVFAIIAIFLVENGHKKLFKRLLHFCSLLLFLACSQRFALVVVWRMATSATIPIWKNKKNTSIIDFFFSHGMKKLKQSKIRCQRLWLILPSPLLNSSKLPHAPIQTPPPPTLER